MVCITCGFLPLYAMQGDGYSCVLFQPSFKKEIVKKVQEYEECINTYFACDDVQGLKQTIAKYEQYTFALIKSGFWPLLTPVYALGSPHLLKVLLENGFNAKSLINRRSPETLLSLLHYAVMGYYSIHENLNNTLEIIKLLVLHGIDINIQERDGNTILWVAANLGYKEIVHLLVSLGANKSIECNAGIYKTPLKIARKRKHSSIVRLLESSLYESYYDCYMNPFDQQCKDFLWDLKQKHRYDQREQRSLAKYGHYQKNSLLKVLAIKKFYDVVLSFTEL